MKPLLLCLALLASPAFATETLLSPGDLSQYLAPSCGGRQWNQSALGFNADSTAVTELTVTTTCATGTGRLRKVRTYSACWIVTYDRTGAIVDAYECPGPGDLALEDVDGATLETVWLSGRERVVLVAP